MIAQQIASRDFGKNAIKALARKGIVFVSVTTLPGFNGSYATGDTGYVVDDNGTGRVLTYSQVRGLL